MTETRLYLYGSDELLLQIKNSYLPVVTNFEFTQPYIDFNEWWQNTTRPVSEEDIEIEQQRQYQLLPDNIKNFLPFDVFKSQTGKISDSIKKAAQERKRGDTITGYNKKSLDKVAMIRLFTTGLSHRAWSEFGEKHSGLCVVLDSSNELFKSNSGKPVQFGPVKYGSEHRMQPSKGDRFPGLMVDHPDNQPLNEWRLIFAKNNIEYWRDEPVVKIDPNVIKGIYWSVYTKASITESVSNLVAQDIRYRHIEIGCVQPHKSLWVQTFKPA